MQRPQVRDDRATPRVSTEKSGRHSPRNLVHVLRESGRPWWKARGKRTASKSLTLGSAGSYIIVSGVRLPGGKPCSAGAGSAGASWPAARSGGGRKYKRSHRPRGVVPFPAQEGLSRESGSLLRFSDPPSIEGGGSAIEPFPSWHDSDGHPDGRDDRAAAGVRPARPRDGENEKENRKKRKKKNGGRGTASRSARGMSVIGCDDRGDDGDEFCARPSTAVGCGTRAPTVGRGRKPFDGERVIVGDRPGGGQECRHRAWLENGNDDDDEDDLERQWAIELDAMRERLQCGRHAVRCELHVPASSTVQIAAPSARGWHVLVRGRGTDPWRVEDWDERDDSFCLSSASVTAIRTLADVSRETRDMPCATAPALSSSFASRSFRPPGSDRRDIETARPKTEEEPVRGIAHPTAKGKEKEREKEREPDRAAPDARPAQASPRETLVRRAAVPVRSSGRSSPRSTAVGTADSAGLPHVPDAAGTPSPAREERTAVRTPERDPMGEPRAAAAAPEAGGPSSLLCTQTVSCRRSRSASDALRIREPLAFTSPHLVCRRARSFDASRRPGVAGSEVRTGDPGSETPLALALRLAMPGSCARQNTARRTHPEGRMPRPCLPADPLTLQRAYLAAAAGQRGLCRSRVRVGRVRVYCATEAGVYVRVAHPRTGRVGASVWRVVACRGGVISLEGPL